MPIKNQRAIAIIVCALFLACSIAMAVEASKTTTNKQPWIVGSVGGFSLMLFACVFAIE